MYFALFFRNALANESRAKIEKKTRDVACANPGKIFLNEKKVEGRPDFYFAKGSI